MSFWNHAAVQRRTARGGGGSLPEARTVSVREFRELLRWGVMFPWGFVPQEQLVSRLWHVAAVPAIALLCKCGIKPPPAQGCPGVLLSFQGSLAFCTHF